MGPLVSAVPSLDLRPAMRMVLAPGQSSRGDDVTRCGACDVPAQSVVYGYPRTIVGPIDDVKRIQERGGTGVFGCAIRSFHASLRSVRGRARSRVYRLRATDAMHRLS
jgi:hypothetical protein